MTDKELIKGIINNNQKSFRELVEKYQSNVIKTCNGFVHNVEDSEDIAQDVFIEIYKSIEKFRGEAKLSTWIYRISVNKSLNFIRKKNKNKIIKSIESFFLNSDNSKYEISDNNYMAENIVENKERAAILHKAINSLSKNQKIAFTLNKYEDLSYKQIAEIMNLSLSSVESLIHRAKKGLQKKLYNYYAMVQ